MIEKMIISGVTGHLGGSLRRTGQPTIYIWQKWLNNKKAALSPEASGQVPRGMVPNINFLSPRALVALLRETSVPQPSAAAPGERTMITVLYYLIATTFFFWLLVGCTHLY